MISKDELTLTASPTLMEIDVVPSPSGAIAHQDARKLLSAIISQARVDQMSMVALGVDIDKKSIVMRYYGPDRDGTPKWWDMTPPPIELYPALVQCVLMLGELQASVPFKGVLRAMEVRKRITIVFELRTPYELTLSWE